MDKTILIIEDDCSIAKLLAYILRKENYNVYISHTGSEGLYINQEIKPNLILLDWSLPDISGIEVCKEVTKTTKTPIIMLTAKNLLEDKLQGLEVGADDYITKPFDVREVIARIKATYRRLENSAIPSINTEENEEFIEIGSLRINVKSMCVILDKTIIELTRLEYNLLLFLYNNKNQVLTRDQLLDGVWGYDYLGNSRTVDIHILRLRKKLNLSNNIETVFKVGYKFII